MELREIRDSFTWVDNSITRSTALTSSDKVVYYSLATYANNETQSCFPSNITLEKVTGLTGRTVTESIKHLEANELIHVKRTSGKVNVYFLLKTPTTLKSSVVKNDSETIEKEHELPQKNNTTNNTNINNNTNKGKYQAKYYKLDSCSRGVQYAVEKLGIRPTESLVTLIDEQFKEYAVAPSINTMLAWCETKGAVPTVVTLSKWLKRDLDSGVMKPKRRS